MPSPATARRSTSSSCCVARLRRSLQITVWFNSIYANHLQTQALQPGSTTRVTPNARCSTQPLPSTTRASLSGQRGPVCRPGRPPQPQAPCAQSVQEGIWGAASARTALRAPAAATADTTFCWPSLAKAVASDPHAPRGAWRRRRPTSLTTSFPACRCASGCCRFRSGCARRAVSGSTAAPSRHSVQAWDAKTLSQTGAHAVGFPGRGYTAR